MHILPSFKDYRTDIVLYESECCEKTCRPCPDDNSLWPVAYVRENCLIPFRRSLPYIYIKRKIDLDCIPARIDALLPDHDICDTPASGLGRSGFSYVIRIREI